MSYDAKLDLLGVVAWPGAATAVGALVLCLQGVDDQGAIGLQPVPVRGDGLAIFLPGSLRFRGSVV